MAKATGARTSKKANSATSPADVVRTDTALPTPAEMKASASAGAGNGRARPNQQELQEAIRHRAYQLYCERGRQGGSPEEDWSRAEREVLAQYGRTA